MKKINLLMAMVFLSVSVIAVFAQQTNTVSKIDPNVVANVQANADLDNQESVNDEGYGVDDAEYYEGEDVNEEMLNEEALNEEMSNENMNEGTDNWEGPAQEEGNAKMPVGNAAE